MHHHDASCFTHPFPPFHSVRCYAYHAYLCHPLAFYASLHAYLYVRALILLASVSSILQHNEGMDIRSKPKFVPRGHHLLFVCLLVSWLSCLVGFLVLSAFLFVHLSCYLSCLLLSAMLPLSIMLTYFAPLPYTLCTFSFHCLSTGFLSLPLHVHI